MLIDFESLTKVDFTQSVAKPKGRGVAAVEKGWLSSEANRALPSLHSTVFPTDKVRLAAPMKARAFEIFF